jgi:hypothetical protein
MVISDYEEFKRCVPIGSSVRVLNKTVPGFSYDADCFVGKYLSVDGYNPRDYEMCISRGLVKTLLSEL